MPFDPLKVAIRGTTQDHLPIANIRDDIIILKDGGCCLIISTTAINFGLLSEREQEAIIYAYAGLLNSLSFQLQILVRSQKKDISQYLSYIHNYQIRESSPEMKDQLTKYEQFVKETVQKNEVLDKKFYLVISMSPLELGVAKTLASTIPGKKAGLPYDENYILERAKVILYPRRDHVLGQIDRLGLKGRQMETNNLIQLFFEIYNPETSGQQMTAIGQFQPPLVRSVFKPTMPQEPGQKKPEPKNEDNTDSIREEIDSIVGKAIK